MIRTPFDDGWSYRPKTSPFLELAGATVRWTEVTVPHDALIGTRRGPDRGDAASAFYAGGVFEYRKRLHLTPQQRGRRVALEFEGVYRGAMVYVNGHFAGQRPYGYSHFTVELTDLLDQHGPNEIRVEATAHADSRWYTGAGIYRPTHLLVGDRLHVEPDGVVIRTPDVTPELASVVVETSLTSRDPRPAAGRLRTQLLDGAGHVVAQDELDVTAPPGQTVRVRQRLLVANPLRWSVDTPHLYTCRTSVLTRAEPAEETLLDEETTSFGIRTLSLDRMNGLRVNGETVLLRGTCVHHDNGVLGAATFARAEERRIELLKEAGFNAVRSAHQPMSRAMLDACDRLGVLVMDEAFDMWTSSKSDDDYARDFPVWWQADVEAMVRKAINHPSVVLYCIGNEIPEMGTAEGAAWARRLADAVRTLDGTRYVTCAVNGLLAAGPELFAELGVDSSAAPADDGVGVNTLLSQMADWTPFLMQQEIVARRTQEAFAALDVAGYNYLESRYDMDGERYPNRIIVGTETWPGQIDRLWRQVQDLPYLLGDFTWTGWDYLGEVGVGRVGYADDPEVTDDVGLMAGYPWRVAWVGDIDITGHRRPASYYREIVFGLRTEPFIAVQRPQHATRTVVHKTPWAWSDSIDSWSWSGFEGLPVRVEVYANADEVELLVDGAPVGRAPAGEAARFRAEFDTVFSPGELTAVAYRDGRAVGRSTLRTARGAVRLEAVADRSDLSAAGSDLSFVSIRLVDEHGTVHQLQDREVQVTVTGAGTLAGLGSADPRSEEDFTESRCRTFDGRALAVVRTTGAGVVELSVTAAECEPVRLWLTAR